MGEDQGLVDFPELIVKDSVLDNVVEEELWVIRCSGRVWVGSQKLSESGEYSFFMFVQGMVYTIVHLNNHVGSKSDLQPLLLLCSYFQVSHVCFS